MRKIIQKTILISRFLLRKNIILRNENTYNVIIENLLIKSKKKKYDKRKRKPSVQWHIIIIFRLASNIIVIIMVLTDQCIFHI